MILFAGSFAMCKGSLTQFCQESTKVLFFFCMPKAQAHNLFFRCLCHCFVSLNYGWCERKQIFSRILSVRVEAISKTQGLHNIRHSPHIIQKALKKRPSHTHRHLLYFLKNKDCPNHTPTLPLHPEIKRAKTNEKTTTHLPAKSPHSNAHLRGHTPSRQHHSAPRHHTRHTTLPCPHYRVPKRTHSPALSTHQCHHHQCPNT